MINLNSINLGSLNLGGVHTSEIKLGYPSSGCPVPGLKGLQGLYMGKGLTNEMMSRDPIWRDKSGKGNHIALKNFGWKLDSGCGKYNQDFNNVRNVASVLNVIEISDSKATFKAIVDMNAATYPAMWRDYRQSGFKVKLSSNINDFKLDLVYRDKKANNIIFKTVTLTAGINNVPSLTDEEFSKLGSPNANLKINTHVRIDDWFTLEQIPDYSGAICFNGVDDFGICETFPVFTKEKGYTVMALRKWLTFSRVSAYLCSKGESRDTSSFIFECTNSGKFLDTYSFNKRNLINHISNNNDPITYQTSTDYNGTSINIGTAEHDSAKFLLGKSVTGGSCINAALYSLAIFDHDTTAEERQPVIDYWKKEFPELFPDQAWTVTGKSNSDADRAVIKNITGNGNDLTLTNFAFADNSGYGKWPFPFPTTSTVFSGQPYGTAHFIAVASTYANIIATNLNSIHFKFRVREMQEGATFVIRAVRMDNFNVAYKDFRVSENGIHEFEYENTDEPFALFFYNGKLGSGVYWDFYVDILQDPDYEGYLVTDGVDDQIISGVFDFGDKWTIVGEWEFLQEESNKLAGIVKFNSFLAYNYVSGVYTYIYNPVGTLLRNTHSIKAATSEGTVYVDFNSAETKVPLGDLDDKKYQLQIAHNNGKQFTKLAFKNIAIYPYILTKEQCIRAYNYLQTIKNN